MGLAVAVAAGSFVATEAGAKKKKHHSKQQVSSQIAIQQAGVNGISGRVSVGPNGKQCRGQRQVALYRVNSQASVPSNEFVASTVSRGDGSWSFPGPRYPSLYVAQISKRSIPRTKKHGALVCRSAASNETGFG